MVEGEAGEEVDGEVEEGRNNNRADMDLKELLVL